MIGSANVYPTKLCELEMTTQCSESKLIYAKIVDSTLSRAVTIALLKTLCFNRDQNKRS